VPASFLSKALARAFRWRKLLETGVYGTIEEWRPLRRSTPLTSVVFCG
jgi:hypothetical protein